MSVAQNESIALCRFSGQHPTVARPATRVPLVHYSFDRAGAWCAATRRGLRAASRPRLRDASIRRPAARNSPPRRTS